MILSRALFTLDKEIDRCDRYPFITPCMPRVAGRRHAPALGFLAKASDRNN
ncbi:hypothetical protein [Microseira wollei]|uniref:Uncharacterized protein n=1 Tax=Microseira wollei NIES-4236 TaxID=2530354 RepID=A0AAV3X6Y8_9CYAN|nr:hypothetical protein [Microseira wollei]GET37909.1 hypothetical protein MiSe_26630 [Microseira wollei NIES-4236]